MLILKRKPSVVYWLGESLYLNITNRCPNNCYFCLRNFCNGVGDFNLKLEREPSTAEVIAELRNVMNRKNWKEIVFCGFGEPLERLDCVVEIAKWIRRYYGKIVALRVNTNGQGFLLNRGRDVIGELKKAGVDKVSVSLNAHNKEVYDQVCKPKFENAFESILEFIEKARKLLDVEITVVRIPEVDVRAAEALAKRLGVKFRVRDYIQPFW
jgi:TatD DNase family protein